MLNIRQASAECRISVHTLRYYERAGLVPGVARGVRGERRYTPRDIDWIRLLGLLRATGMPISRIRRFLRIHAQGDGAIAERIAFFEAYKEELVGRMATIRQACDLIDYKIEANRTLLSRAASGDARG